MVTRTSLPPRSPVGEKVTYVKDVEALLSPVELETPQWTTFEWDHKIPDDPEVAPYRATADARFVRLPPEKQNLVFHANAQSGDLFVSPVVRAVIEEMSERRLPFFH